MAAAGRAGMAANGQHLGVTEPISIAGPTEMDCIKTRELEKVKRKGSTTGLGFFLLVVWFDFLCRLGEDPDALEIIRMHACSLLGGGVFDDGSCFG
jgi:hypothetical protein